MAQSRELIKDKIAVLIADEMGELVASILRAMGYKAKVSPEGSDQGVVVIASPDGLGLTQTRIKAEVKHRNGSMGAPTIRSVLEPYAKVTLICLSVPVASPVKPATKPNDPSFRSP